MNPGQITDRQTAPSRLFSPEDGACSDAADVISSDTVSVGSSLVTHAGSLDKATCSNVSEPVSTGQSSLDDILFLPSVKSKTKARSVNSSARCITNDSFIQELEEKEEEKRKKEEEMIAKREESARRKEQREKEKIEKEQRKQQKEKTKSRRTKGSQMDKSNRSQGMKICAYALFVSSISTTTVRT